MRIKAFVRTLRIKLHAAWLCAQDFAEPLPVRLFGLLLAAYAFSPIDLIPDFIPIIGLLDDLVLLPLGLWLFVKMIPVEIFARHVATAELAATRPASKWGAALVIALWLLILTTIAVIYWR
jgi:uncharacterized membrane protein YkvA (DUF1232 family)